MSHIKDDQLDLYVSRRLNEDAEAEVEEHLLLCGECRTRAETAEIFISTLKAVVPVEVETDPAGLRARKPKQTFGNRAMGAQ